MERGAAIWMVRLEPVAAPQINHPLGYMYLASALRRAGFGNLRIIDVPAARLPWRLLLDAVGRERPAVVFLTAYTVDMPIIARFSQRLAAAGPDTIQLVGGPQSTGDPEGVLQALPAVTAAIRGEGEETAVELLEALRPDGRTALDGILGIAWRTDDGEIITNPARPLPPTLDDDLWPAYDLIDVPVYFRRSRMGVLFKHPEYMTIFTSRGCTYGCNFCHEVFGKVWRPLSADRVLDEMDFVVRTYGIREFQIVDDLFNGNRERTLAICQGMVDRDLKFKIAFPNGLRADRLRVDEIEALHAAGTWRTCVSPETASPRIQAQIGKHANLDRIRDAIHELVKRDILTSGFFMLGFPGETREELEATIRWALDSELHMANFFRVIPFPGCRLREDASSHGIEVENIAQAFEGAGTNFNLSPLPDELVERRHREAIKAFYGNPRRLARLTRLLPKQPSLWPAYLVDGLVRIGVGTIWPQLMGKLNDPEGGVRSLWQWFRTGDAHGTISSR